MKTKSKGRLDRNFVLINHFKFLFMIQSYKGNYLFDKETVQNWNSSVIGVYYCGDINNNGSLTVLYVGKATSEEGIRGRLLQHLNEEKWSDITHFGYCVCTTSEEAEKFEASEIMKYQPKYNKQGKSL